MKFKLTTLLIGLTALSACSSSTNQIKILTPTGAPAIAFYDFSSYQNFETNSVPSNVIAAIRNNSDYDVVIAPTQGGIQAINRDIKESGYSDFKIASTITFGNFYLAATGNDEDKTLNQGDIVVLFSENELPDKLFKALYSDMLDKLSIKYVTAAGDAVGVLKTGTMISESSSPIPVDYVLVAEPSMQGALKANPSASVYQDIQALYKSKNAGKIITQASVFVNTKKNLNAINDVLTKLEGDINKAISNPNLIKDGLDKYQLDESMLKIKFGIPSTALLLSSMTSNTLGLGYKNAYSIKESIDAFLGYVAPKIGVTNEEIYYK